jgi:ABC-type nitrate/sulfonate/bicarbonate transport system permease component
MGAITAIVAVVIGFLLGSIVALPNGFLFIHTQTLQK